MWKTIKLNASQIMGWKCEKKDISITHNFSRKTLTKLWEFSNTRVDWGFTNQLLCSIICEHTIIYCTYGEEGLQNGGSSYYCSSYYVIISLTFYWPFNSLPLFLACSILSCTTISSHLFWPVPCLLFCLIFYLLLPISKTDHCIQTVILTGKLESGAHVFLSLM